MSLALVFVALLATLPACRGCSARADGPDASDVATLALEPYRVRAAVPAIAWSVVDPSSERAGAVGLADVESHEAATASTPFEAASIAKPIIATCVLQLVEEGRMSLDADVSAYVGFRIPHAGTQPITLRHLLSHTAGIIDPASAAAAGGDAKANQAELAGVLASTIATGPFLDAGPGVTMAYSNVGPSLAALAVERATQTPFAERARARVFAPLGMTSTAFGHDSRAATPYALRGDAFVRLSPASHALYPVVDLFASARDLGRFARAILRNGELDGSRILAPASVREMLRVQFPSAAPDDALGWQHRTFGSAHVVGHEGEDTGASTGLYLDPASKKGVVVLTNGNAFQSEDQTRSAALADLIANLLLR